ncbi:MAG: hypothetical protein K2X38_05765 [Gemmataceae bacterium]|nr:hypothetical protein [Gemmataceae bacterium]
MLFSAQWSRPVFAELGTWHLHAESDLDILQEVELPLDEFMDESAARALLAIRFSPQATKRLERLLGKNAKGSITAEERLLLEKNTCAWDR